MREGWITTTLGEVAETQLGKALPRGGGRDPGGDRYLRNVNVQWGRLATDGLNRMQFSTSERERLTLRRGDILLCEGGEVGRLALVTEDLSGIYFQNAIHRVRVDRRRALPELVALALEHLVRSGGLDGLTTRVTIAHLNQTKLRGLPLVLPPLAEQRRIVDLIGTFDGALAALQTSRDAAERLLGSLRDQVPDGDPESVGSVVKEVVNGITTTAEDQAAGTGTQRLMKASAIWQGACAWQELKSAPDRVYDDKYYVRDGEVLMTRINTPLRVGQLAVAVEAPASVLRPDLVWRLEVDKKRMLPSYFVHAFSGPGGRRVMTSAASGTSRSMQQISKSRLGCLPISVPSLAEQRSYVQRCDLMAACVARLVRLAEQLEAARTAALAALPSGEHEIPESYDELLAG